MEPPSPSHGLQRNRCIPATVAAWLPATVCGLLALAVACCIGGAGAQIIDAGDCIALFSWKPLAALEAPHPCSPLRDCLSYLQQYSSVECTSEGRVQYLSLSGMNLTGTLPRQWSNMTALTLLSVDMNKLSGTLPSEWSTMTQLDVLGVEKNQLTGTLPPEWSTMTKMTKLHLEWNQLTGTLPPEWGAMTQLAWMSANQNRLTGALPPEWSNMTQLWHMNCSGNQLSGTLPPEWSAMTAMWDVSLYMNNLSGTLPPEWSAMTQLEFLELFQNRLTGSLPPAWSALKNLILLNVYNNQMTGTLPPEWSTMTQFFGMWSGNNHLSGTLPPEWSTMTQLGYMDFGNNNITGSLPPEWSTMTSLTFMSLSNNSLTGTLPPFPPDVKIFSASSNKISGTIPPIPRTMEYLHLGSNSLTGSVPSTSVNHSVMYANMDDNQLSSLPGVYAAKGALYLSVARNHLNGTLPDFGHYAPSLVYCDLSDNMLVGNMTDASFGSQKWAYLALDNNSLSGSLPNVCKGNVRVLLLQHNSISGCLPESWVNNRSLTVLDLSNNSMACPRGLPVNWISSSAFQNLLVLSLHSNRGLARTPVPSAWLAASSFQHDTSLWLGDLWRYSAKSRRWRKQVCIQRNWYDRLQSKLVSVNVDRPILEAVQASLADVLAELTRDKTKLGEYFTSVHLDVGAAALRAGNASPPSLKDICGNPAAWRIVVVQWLVVGVCLLALFAAHAAESRWGIVSRLLDYAAGCLPKASSGSSSWFSVVVGKLIALRYLVALASYWFDIVMDIVLVQTVLTAGANLGYGLLVVLLAHYVVLAQLVAWRCVEGSKLWRALAALLALLLAPLMPLVDTVTFVVVATQPIFSAVHTTADTAGSWLARLDVQSDEWMLLFETREVLEVVLEAIPTSVLQTVVFLAGNSPTLGIYLDETLYLLSSVGSGMQILRLTGGVLWAATQQRRSTWDVLRDRLYVGRGPQRVQQAVTILPQQDSSYWT